MWLGCTVDAKELKTALYRTFQELAADLVKQKDADAWPVIAVTAVQVLLDIQGAIVTVAAAGAALAEKLAEHRESVEELIGAVDELRTGGSPPPAG